MRITIISQYPLANLVTLATIFLGVLSSSKTIGQEKAVQDVERAMPDDYLLTYTVYIKTYVNRAQQQKEYEAELAQANEMKQRNKDLMVFPSKPGPVPDTSFEISFGQSQKRFYWTSNEKVGGGSFIYDGKRSYYYDRFSHRMFVYGGFHLYSGMTLPLPGRSSASIPLVLHPSVSRSGQVDGDVYCGLFRNDGKPAYIPGKIEFSSANPVLIDRAVSYNKTKMFYEYVFSNYLTSGRLIVPRKIIGRLYNQQTKENRDDLFQESRYQLTSFSLSPPPENLLNPINLLERDKEGVKTSPEFVQWYFDDGREITVYYKHGKSLEEQVGIEDYQQKKASNRVENGKIDPRNYAGLGLLIFLVAAAGWKIISALKARRMT